MPFEFMRGNSGFESYDRFAPETLPEPGPFLRECTVLSGREHVAFHRLTRRLFEERGVYDVTFGYNLARLNVDRNHPDAGFRYARESPSVLRAEFSPTTEFCPQTDTLTRGAFRAWNGLSSFHEYDRVRVRVHPEHHESGRVNEALAELEAAER